MAHHPVGIVLRRVGYSTIPTMKELSVIGLDDNGECIVPSFTVVRQGYVKYCFEGPLNVCNLNMDEIGMLINNHKA
jgi:nuclear pore complex protein Nup98-Nup96